MAKQDSRVVVGRFGVDKVFKLYNSYRPATFEDDCRRILGPGIDELEAELCEYFPTELRDRQPEVSGVYGGADSLGNNP